MLDVGNSTILEYQIGFYDNFDLENQDSETFLEHVEGLIGVYDNFDLEHQELETFLEHVEGLIFCQHDCEKNEAINYGPDIEYT